MAVDHPCCHLLLVDEAIDMLKAETVMMNHLSLTHQSAKIRNPFRSSKFNLSHSPLNDPKRGELYNKYLGGIDGLDLMDYNTSCLEELGFEGREIETTIMRDIAALLD
jgi:hypothetical protein